MNFLGMFWLIQTNQQVKPDPALRDAFMILCIAAPAIVVLIVYVAHLFTKKK